MLSYKCMTSIGQILADARRKRKLTVKDVEKAIKIRAKYITALEQDAFDQILGEAYVIGFLKTYAQWLEIDAGAMLDQYRAQTGSARKAVPAGQERADEDTQSLLGSRLFLAALAAVVAILGAAKIIMMVLPAAGR